MNDVIYKQAAIDVIHGYFDGMLETDTWSPCDVYGLIEILPSADAVEVVRCKDCKHYQFADNRAFGFPVKRCEWTGFEDVDDDDFCSRGERKDG